LIKTLNLNSDRPDNQSALKSKNLRYKSLSYFQRRTNLDRIFASYKFFQPNDGEPIRTVVTQSDHAVVVAWHVNPQQIIPPHIHPYGQDTWTILSGKGDYYLDRQGNTKAIEAGDVVVAPIGCVHGVINTGEEPLTFISVVTPLDAGYEMILLEKTDK